jgi:hypothetical protein
MPKISVVYKAPEGDAKVTNIFGHTLYDGKAEEIEVSEEQAEKIKNNPIFRPGGKAQPDHPAKDRDK